MRNLFQSLVVYFKTRLTWKADSHRKGNRKREDQLENPAILGIFDTFTYNCLEPEFEIITPNPESAISVIENPKIAALFYESAWHGNNDTWLYQIGKYNNQSNKKLKELVAIANKLHKPVIFWNKEDPVHFEHFIVAGQQADYVFTTDSDCIPAYRERLGHQNIFALPFAAQPLIHNPIGEGPRTNTVCFAGSYHTERYKERQTDLDILLKPALEYGLDIFDRNFNADGVTNPKYKFPDIYTNSIRGKLEYSEMVKAYKRYKVFLNVNSVRNSPTMFSRRVFELLASGTPVISTYSKGIVDILSSDTVLISTNESDTKQYLEKLLYDEDYWWQISLRGMRIVYESHTYYHRVLEIFSRAGISHISVKPVSFLIVTPVNSLEDASFLFEVIDKQIYKQFSLLIICRDHGFVAELFPLISNRTRHKHQLEILASEQLESCGSVWNSMENSHVVVVQHNNFYGKNYLRDYAIAIKYSKARIFGKNSYFAMTPDKGFSIANPGSEYTFNNVVSAGSVVMQKSLASIHLINNLLLQNTYINSDFEILSIDPYNYIPNGRHIQLSFQKRTEI